MKPDKPHTHPQGLSPGSCWPWGVGAADTGPSAVCVITDQDVLPLANLENIYVQARKNKQHFIILLASRHDVLYTSFSFIFLNAPGLLWCSYIFFLTAFSFKPVLQTCSCSIYIIGYF